MRCTTQTAGRSSPGRAAEGRRRTPAGHRSPGRADAPASRCGTLVLIVLSLLWLVPVVLIVSTALKTRADVKTNPFGLFTSFSLAQLRPRLDGAVTSTTTC